MAGQGRVGDAHHLGATELLGDGELGGVCRVPRHLDATGGLLVAEPLLGGCGLQLDVGGAIVGGLAGCGGVGHLAGVGRLISVGRGLIG